MKNLTIALFLLAFIYQFSSLGLNSRNIYSQESYKSSWNDSLQEYTNIGRQIKPGGQGNPIRKVSIEDTRKNKTIVFKVDMVNSTDGTDRRNSSSILNSLDDQENCIVENCLDCNASMCLECRHNFILNDNSCYGKSLIT